MKHTPEPWLNVRPGHMLGTYEIGEAEDHLSDSVALPGEQYKEIHKANAERIMACVNGCAGINPESVPELLATLELMAGDIDGYLRDDWDGNREGWEALSRRAHATIAQVRAIKEG